MLDELSSNYWPSSVYETYHNVEAWAMMGHTIKSTDKRERITDLDFHPFNRYVAATGYTSANSAGDVVNCLD